MARTQRQKRGILLSDIIFVKNVKAKCINNFCKQLVLSVYVIMCVYVIIKLLCILFGALITLKAGRCMFTHSRGVNLYVFHVSLTDFHCFDWLTDVRGNPYGFKKKKNYLKKKLKIFFFFFFIPLAISMS